MSSVQIDLLEQARTLADRLRSQTPPVKAGTLRSLTADLVASPKPDKDRLLRLLELVAAGKGGHLRRTGNFPDQALQAIAVLQEFLQTSTHSPEELRTVLGWAGRLLLVERRATKKKVPKGPGGGPKPGPPKRSPFQPEPTISKPRQTGKLNAVKGQGLSELEKMRARLEQQEKGTS